MIIKATFTIDGKPLLSQDIDASDEDEEAIKAIFKFLGLNGFYQWVINTGAYREWPEFKDKAND